MWRFLVIHTAQCHPKRRQGQRKDTGRGKQAAETLFVSVEGKLRNTGHDPWKGKEETPVQDVSFQLLTPNLKHSQSELYGATQ